MKKGLTVLTVAVALAAAWLFRGCRSDVDAGDRKILDELSREAPPVRAVEAPAAEKRTAPAEPAEPVLRPRGALAPTKAQGRIGQMVIGRMEMVHVSGRSVDDEISRRAWTNLVTGYDFNRMVFLRRDIDGFTNRLEKIDDEIRAGNVGFGFEVYNLFVKRFTERMTFVTNLLATTTFDFAKDEDYTWKRKDAPWPETEAERDELWRKRIKNEYLMQVLGRELDAEKAAAESNRTARAAAKRKAKKDDAKKDAAKKDDAKKDDDYKEPELAPRENLIKKYRQYAIAMTEPDEENVLQRYLSALTTAFDPHSDYMSPMRKEDFDQGMSLSLQGVGAVLSMDEGALKIVEVMTGGPIARDGRIRKGDKIVGVDEHANGRMEDILYKPMRKTIRKIRGPKGTRVTLEIIPRDDPSGATRRRYTLVRDEIKLEEQAATGRVERVTLNGVENRFGYVRLPGFYGDGRTRSCSADVAKYVERFVREKTDGMILDLRGNGGGSLQESALLAQLFLPGTCASPYGRVRYPVVQIRDKTRTQVLPVFPERPTFVYRKPMIVLIDRASASASEIVAGVLRDAGRAVIVGDRTTHGKGTVQTVLPLGGENNGSIKVTTARFYRINGSSTQVNGVPSDIDLPGVLEELDIGEDKLPYALPWTRVQGMGVTTAWNLDRYVPALKKLSQARCAGNARYKAHTALVRHTKEVSERITVPLARAKRLKLMREDRAASEADEETPEDAEEAEEKEATKKNGDGIVLEESFNILSDLVRLTGGADAPASDFMEIFR